MCGIFGIVASPGAHLTAPQCATTLRMLFRLSESRGKEAAGLAALLPNAIEVLKAPVAASAMIRTPVYRDLLKRTLSNHAGHEGLERHPLALIGHSRLVTTGSQDRHGNNQPVILDGLVAVHNGIIVNQEEIWTHLPLPNRQHEVDTECIVRLVHHYLAETGSLPAAVRRTFREIRGTASIAVLFSDLDVLLLATNTGSLYRCTNSSNDVVLFASERRILRVITEQAGRPCPRDSWDICGLSAGQGCLVSIRDTACLAFALEEDEACAAHVPRSRTSREVRDLGPIVRRRGGWERNADTGLQRQHDGLAVRSVNRLRERYPYDTSAADRLRRCARCILPETMPFIEFDDCGVCNYCHAYARVPCLGKLELLALADRHRRSNGDPECVVGISGGRDSLYGLHYIKNVLKLKPIAFTYDWGMVTDVARRNIARVCGKLGIEQVLVSADIAKKRSFIRANVAAWLKRPVLGTIPLFMAGDKQYFFYLRQVRRQVGVELTFLCENMLERTDFKSGYAGVKPFGNGRFQSIPVPLSSRLGILLYYARECLMNPDYLNESLADTLCAYACYYFLRRRYVNTYAYVPWVEEEVVGTLIREYDFELASDTKCTWRIGDGTAAFYNYIYYAVTGFSEHDTFRSNQIREGHIDRAEALRRVREENAPRYASIDWYLRTISLSKDADDVFAIINRIPKRYST